MKIVDKTILAVQRMFREEILVLGDSHAAIFDFPSLRSAFPRHCFNVVSVGGATVSGLENPNSKTQCRQVFSNSLQRSSAKTVIFQIGEVDVGFVIWYRAIKYNADIESMLELALANYQRLILEAAASRRVICVSAPLPTIEDGEIHGEVANARRAITASQAERTALTLTFNRAIKEFCSKSNVVFIDLDSISLGRNGLVDSKLLNSCKGDHHYDAVVYSDIVKCHIAPHIL